MNNGDLTRTKIVGVQNGFKEETRRSTRLLVIATIMSLLIGALLGGRLLVPAVDAAPERNNDVGKLRRLELIDAEGNVQWILTATRAVHGQVLLFQDEKGNEIASLSRDFESSAFPIFRVTDGKNCVAIGIRNGGEDTAMSHLLLGPKVPYGEWLTLQRGHVLISSWLDGLNVRTIVNKVLWSADVGEGGVIIKKDDNVLSKWGN